MADTQPLAPTDIDIDALWVGQQLTVPQLVQRRVIARAVLAKWGTPAPVGVEPAAWKHDCAALLMNDVELWIDACPHCVKPRNAPQPVVREPLTDEQSYALLHRMADESDKWAEGLSYEPTREQVSGWCVAFLMRELPAPGIKGGQHDF